MLLSWLLCDMFDMLIPFYFVFHLYVFRMYFGLTELRMEAEFPGGRVHAVDADFDATDVYGR